MSVPPAGATNSALPFKIRGLFLALVPSGVPKVDPSNSSSQQDGAFHPLIQSLHLGSHTTVWQPFFEHVPVISFRSRSCAWLGDTGRRASLTKAKSTARDRALHATLWLQPTDSPLANPQGKASSSPRSSSSKWSCCVSSLQALATARRMSKMRLFAVRR